VKSQMGGAKKTNDVSASLKGGPRTGKSSRKNGLTRKVTIVETKKKKKTQTTARRGRITEQFHAIMSKGHEV